jgi:hypothetical protein
MKLAKKVYSHLGWIKNKAFCLSSKELWGIISYSLKILTTWIHKSLFSDEIESLWSYDLLRLPLWEVNSNLHFSTLSNCSRYLNFSLSPVKMFNRGNEKVGCTRYSIRIMYQKVFLHVGVENIRAGCKDFGYWLMSPNLL